MVQIIHVTFECLNLTVEKLPVFLLKLHLDIFHDRIKKISLCCRNIVHVTKWY